MPKESNTTPPSAGNKNASFLKDLEMELAAAQRQLHGLGVPVLVLIDGWDATGRGEVINHLLLTMNPSWIRFHPFHREGIHDHQSFSGPGLQAYWKRLPAKGTMAIFDRGWSHDLLQRWRGGGLNREQALQHCEDINAFEALLREDGCLILKFFLDISKLEQKRRLQALAKRGLGTLAFSDRDILSHRQHGKERKLVDYIIAHTDNKKSPWHIVDASGRKEVLCGIIDVMIQSMKPHTLKKNLPLKIKPRTMKVPATLRKGQLDLVDLEQKIEVSVYENRLKDLHKKISELQLMLYHQKIPVILVFEGSDGGGKGGAIKRLARALDPRGYQIINTAAPTSVEASNHYLWRFWIRMPAPGHIAIFDRSWYGRVLVERVEGFCSDKEWARAYSEINTMEEQWSRSGAVVLKYWLHVSRDEQLRRFQERQRTQNKKWKITDEDWRNREKWQQYKVCVENMLKKTDTPEAPWVTVAGDDKHHARIQVLQTYVDAVNKKLDSL